MIDNSFNESKVWISVTHTANTQSNTGIQRVVRNLSRELQEICNVEFIRWNKKKHKFYPIDPSLKSFRLSEFGGPSASKINSDWKKQEIKSSSGNVLYFARNLGLFKKRSCIELSNFLSKENNDWLLLPELMTSSESKNIIAYAQDKNLKIASIFYDAIPINHPEWVNDRIRENHSGYMAALASTDLVIPISKNSANDFISFCKRFYLKLPQVSPCPLAGDPFESRSNSFKNRFHDSQKILCVGTLEPRKNHRRLLEAYERIALEFPNFSLTLVGAPYKGEKFLIQQVQNLELKYSNFCWKKNTTDEELKQLYQQCTFTVFPSLDEGFGLPILESIAHGKPCITSNFGVMSELARDGGCITCDTRSSDALADCIHKLLTDKNLLKKLTFEACSKPVRTWSQYASEIMKIMNLK